MVGFAGVASAEVRPATERSLVRLVNVTQRGDWTTPWEVSPVRQSAGSGFIIAGGRVMTNAHVVSDTRFLVMYLHNDPTPHEAVVDQIAHDCDLALVRAKEPGLLEKLPALEFAGMPLLGSTVETLGFPVGGTRVSSTRGVVSRIEDQVYVHSGADRHLAVQTDAAINPGNSGGPVIQNGNVVGVAFQAMFELESTGWFIPIEVIQRFLEDVSDGRYDGYPELGVVTSNLENPAARRGIGLGPNDSGVRVESVWPGSSAAGHLQPRDALVAVDGRPIALDGTVSDGDERFPFGLLVDRRQIGQTVNLTVLKNGERLDLPVTLRGFEPAQRHRRAYDRMPRYFVYAGLVFVPLELETLITLGDDWLAHADRALLYEFLLRPLEDPSQLRRERIILLRRLDHAVNANLAWFRNQVVESVNGRRIDSIEDLIEALEGAMGPHQIIEFSTFRRIAVLDRVEAESANPEILERYGVSKDRGL